MNNEWLAYYCWFVNDVLHFFKKKQPHRYLKSDQEIHEEIFTQEDV